MTDELVEIGSHGRIAVVTMSNPRTRNALSLEMRCALIAAFEAVLANPEYLAVVVTGAGGAFCAGGDLRQTSMKPDLTDDERRKRLQLAHVVIRLMVCGAKPVIAAVEGPAFGAGLSMAMACDYVVASREATFCASFGRVGLMADTGLLWTLPQRVGGARTRELVMSARVVSAAEALDMQLVEEVAESGMILQTAISCAERFSRIAPLSAAACRAVLSHAPSSLDAVLAAELQHQPTLSASADCAEGKRAFFEKREPLFLGK